jgi:voltage-gated potassium channel
MFNVKQFRYLLFIPLVTIIIGTGGFMWLEKLSFLDALYFTIVTIATVGYGDISPATAGGKILAIFIIIIGIGTFVTLLTSVAQRLLQRRQQALNKHRMSMLVGVFFTEAGNDLLRLFSRFDPEIKGVRKDFMVTAEWTPEKFGDLKKRLGKHAHKIDPTNFNLEQTFDFLRAKGDLLIRQLENSDMIENESFTGLLWATVHLRDELAARHDLKNLPTEDVAHIANDAKRAYSLLTLQWIDYLQFLKLKYPFLFSLALRTNPFVESPDAVIKA